MQFFFSRDTVGGEIEIKVNLEDEKFMGKKAKFRFSLRAMGQDLQYFDKVLLEVAFDVQKQQMVFNVPAEKTQNWLYKGTNLNVYYNAEVFVDGFLGMGLKGTAIFNDEKYFKIYTVTPSKVSPTSGTTVNYWKTFLIMSLLKKFIVLLSVALILGLVGNLFSPFFTADGRPIFVELTESWIALVAFAILFIVGCFATTTNFIKVQWVSPLPKIARDSQLRLSQLIRSQANLNLTGLSVELVGHVMEKYEYVSRGKNSRSVKNANEPVNYFSFFNQTVEFLPKSAPLESSVSQTIDFGKFYSNVLPNFEVSPLYGVGMRVDLYIRSKEFPDIKLELPLETMEKVQIGDPEKTTESK